MNTSGTFSINFWLSKAKMRGGLAPIYCRITINGQRTEISTKRSIEPTKWDSHGSGMVKGKSEEARVMNVYLGMMKTEIENHVNILHSKGEFITPDKLKKSIKGEDYENTGEQFLFKAFEYHNSQMEARIGIDVVKATHTKFETVLKKLREFVKLKRKASDVYLKELNNKFVVDFEYYLKVNDKIAHNTVMKYIQNLKKVVNMCVANGWLDKDPFVSFKLTRKNVIRDILSMQDIQTLRNKVFEIERLEEVKDIFLFCCFTGFSFIDVEKLSVNELIIGIDGGKWIYTNRKKTGNQSNVPLLPAALEIVDKYKEHPTRVVLSKLLPVKSNQKMNAYLKEIGDLCGIAKPLTMHLARHTFATTITLNNGVPMETVSKMLGHTKLSTTQLYAKVLETKVSDDMSQLRDKLFAKSM